LKQACLREALRSRRAGEGRAVPRLMTLFFVGREFRRGGFAPLIENDATLNYLIFAGIRYCVKSIIRLECSLEKEHP